jgi:hypothetical protein
MGDVDKDGTSDFLITSGWSGVHGFHSGRVFIISSGSRPTNGDRLAMGDPPRRADSFVVGQEIAISPKQ